MSKYLLDLSKEFAGKRAIVTGGSRGIGAATAQRLIDAGAKVVVIARSPHEETPKEATFVSGDLRTLEGARKVARDAIERLGGVDILVNGAGAARVHFPDSTAISDEEWVDSLNINFLSALRVTNALLAELKKSKGAIVNITSGGRIAFAGAMAHYGAAKAALNNWSEALAKNSHPRACASTSSRPARSSHPAAMRCASRSPRPWASPASSSSPRSRWRGAPAGPKSWPRRSSSWSPIAPPTSLAIPCSSAAGGARLRQCSRPAEHRPRSVAADDWRERV
jgi:NAD(P)-dependent dehydrogenase (short-subunit alcohol dehydrogenase family)